MHGFRCLTGSFPFRMAAKHKSTQAVCLPFLGNGGLVLRSPSFPSNSPPFNPTKSRQPSIIKTVLSSICLWKTFRIPSNGHRLPPTDAHHEHDTLQPIACRARTNSHELHSDRLFPAVLRRHNFITPILAVTVVLFMDKFPETYTITFTLASLALAIRE